MPNQQQLENKITSLEKKLKKKIKKPLQVVTKKIRKGPQGGLYYLNANGKKMYLKPSQKQQCYDGRLQKVKGDHCN